jgi:hypothetical protein
MSVAMMPPAASLKASHPKAAFCITCNSVKLSGLTHRSRSKQHQLREVSEHELEQYLKDRSDAAQSSGSGRQAGASEGGGSAADQAVYYMEFGKYKKRPPRSLDWIIENDKKYLEFLTDPAQGVYRQWPNLQVALQGKGLLPDVVAVPIPRGVHAQTYLRLVAGSLGGADDGDVVPAESDGAIVPFSNKKKKVKKASSAPPAQKLLAVRFFRAQCLHLPKWLL